MNTHAFPIDLLDGIKTRWTNVSEQHFELPEDRILKKLLEICYHASFRTNEQRAVHCVVACIPMADVPKGDLRITNQPVALTAIELVRLSPVTQHGRTMICCDPADDWLRIWGFFEHEHAWVQYSAGDPPAAQIQLEDIPPDCLTVTIESAGALTVSRGRRSLVRLRDGRIIFPQINPLEDASNPLGSFVNEMVDHLHKTGRQANLQDDHAHNIGQRSLLNIYATTIRAILERIRLRHHGGCIVITRTPLDENMAHTTYATAEHTGLFEDIMAYKVLDDALRFSHGKLDDRATLEKCQSELSLQQISRRLIRSIDQMSLLAAVDGAVLMDDRLRCHGFGVRFPVLLPPRAQVTDALLKINHDCEQWGLRHQSVFSVCHKSEQAVGLIVSQDGEAKAVKSVKGRLMFWSGILD